MTPPSTLVPLRWRLRAPDVAHVSAIARAERLPEPAAAVLVNRGHRPGEALRRHLAPRLTELHDPLLLPDMELAAERLARALRDREPILVHGDYDVDGVTGTALLVRLLRHLRADVHWHIPNRFTDGYAFGEHSLREARAVGARLVVSVDNGTSEVETIGRLAELGIDTVVTDHHEPPKGELPAAVAIVNPKLARSTYPFRELCGGAVAFKLAWGLCQALSDGARVRSDLRDFLIEAMAYVAIATVCDVVPLVDENRVLARYGLRALAATRAPGLRELLRAAGLRDGTLLAEDVGFQVGPRLNASGRLGSAATAVELLLADDQDAARSLASRVDELNGERKRVQQAVLEEALEEARRFDDPERWPVLVVAREGWHQGVVGIVAARLVETFHRPAIVVGLDGELGRGSARSVAGFSVLEAMHAGRDEMQRYGGHAMAAGCEILPSRVDAMREAVCARARAMLGEREAAPRELDIDWELPLAAVGPELMDAFELLEPFGERNEKPLLLTSDARLASPPERLGADGAHLRLAVRQGACVHKALGFGLGHRCERLRMGEPLHLVYSPRWNTFRGEKRLELVLADLASGARPAGLSV